MDGQSKTLAGWKADRFDRRGMGAVGRMLDEFDRRQSLLVSISEGPASSLGGHTVFAILSERAREEAKGMAKRVKVGHDSDRAEGRRGTGRPPFGLCSAPGSGKVETPSRGVRHSPQAGGPLARLVRQEDGEGTAHRKARTQAHACGWCSSE